MVNSLKGLENFADALGHSARMPALFIGHGSPMNAIEENEFTLGFKSQVKDLQLPKAILVISAHWETIGTKVTAMSAPRTIHDFGGFPRALHEAQYPAPGDPIFAQELSELVQPKGKVTLDHEWGLDHGTWSVLKQMYPMANIPVLQLSLDRRMKPQEHYKLSQQLKTLRDKGILIIGSGNMVHNLRMVAWDKMGEDFAFDWAKEANDKMKSFIKEGQHQALIDFKKQGQAFDLAINSAEHYLPLLYILALADKKDKLSFFNDKALAGSLTMTSFRFG